MPAAPPPASSMGAHRFTSVVGVCCQIRGRRTSPCVGHVQVSLGACATESPLLTTQLFSRLKPQTAEDAYVTVRSAQRWRLRPMKARTSSWRASASRLLSLRG